MHQYITLNRLAIAFVVYVALGVLAWTTLPNSRVRMVTLAILGLFAVKTWLHRKNVTHSGGDRDWKQ